MVSTLEEISTYLVSQLRDEGEVFYLPTYQGSHLPTYQSSPSSNLLRGEEEAVRSNFGCAVAWPSQGHIIHLEIKNLNIVIGCNEIIVSLLTKSFTLSVFHT